MLPKQRNVQLPLLKVLSEAPAGLSCTEAAERVARYFDKITDEDLRKRTASGWPWWRNRVQWARQELVVSGDMEKETPRDVWKISKKGKKLLAAEWEDWKPEYSTKAAPRKTKAGETPEPTSNDVEVEEAENPEERLDIAYKQIRNNAKNELLKRILDLKPEVFEVMVAHFLERLGYGNRETGTLTITPQSGDGGIDAECSMDALGVQQIVVQVKRWKPGRNIQRPDIQRLEGARSGKRANAAIFVTTSGFSKGAREEANRSNIRLIDGDRLTDICMKKGIGIERKPLPIPKIDEGFFSNL